MGSDETALVLMKFIQSEPLFITVLSLTFNYMLTSLILGLYLIPPEESLYGRV